MIRSIREADISTLLQIMQQHIPKYFDKSELADFEYYLANEREDYFVAEANGSVVAGGGINYLPKEQLARISWDMVDERWRGKGLGSALLTHRLEHIRKQGTYAKVEVRTSQLAQAFYATHGFTLSYRENDFWGPGLHLCQMERSI